MADGQVKTLEQGCAYIKRFGVASSVICSTNHCYQSVARILIILHAQNRPVALWEGDLSLSKVYEEPLGYAEGSLLTLRNHFIQHYTLSSLNIINSWYNEYAITFTLRIVFKMYISNKMQLFSYKNECGICVWRHFKVVGFVL